MTVTEAGPWHVGARAPACGNQSAGNGEAGQLAAVPVEDVSLALDLPARGLRERVEIREAAAKAATSRIASVQRFPPER